jgi:hypothetical protein
MTFKEALHKLAEGVIIRLLTGDWCPGLTKQIREVRTAFHELEVRVLYPFHP